jgi:hypothetical protein
MPQYPKIKNSDWIQQSFILRPTAINDGDMQRRLMTMAAWKFTDTTAGGNFSINNPPQYTRFADIKTGGFTLDDPKSGLSSRAGGRLGSVQGRYLTGGKNMGESVPKPFGSRGMGRFYSEQIDDNGVYVHLRFGVPEFNSLTQFFGAFYDPQASAFARTAKGSSVLYTAGKIAGAVVTLPLQPAVLFGKVYRFMSGIPASKFYYLKPSMAMYWTAVNTIANGIAVNMGLIPKWTTFGSEEYSSGQRAAQRSLYSEYAANYSGSAGNILNPAQIQADQNSVFDNQNDALFSGKNGNGGIDVRAIALRAQALAMKSGLRAVKALESVEDLADYRQAIITAQNATRGEGYVPSRSFDAYIQSYLGVSKNNLKGKAEAATEQVEQRQQYNSVDDNGRLAAISGKTVDVSAILGIPQSSPGSGTPPEGGTPTGTPSSSTGPSSDSGGALNSVTTAAKEFFEKYGEAAINEGSEFITFKVDNQNNSSESFSSSVRESDIASRINSASSTARETRFSLAEGNVGSGAIAGTIEAALGGIKNVVSGAADSVGISGIATLAGSAFVDIPKHWENSISQMPTAEYTIQLRTPYGNKMSRMQNLYIPLAMLLAGALPLSTGPHSYTSPFICEVYSKGRVAIRLGMIQSLTISRGQGNVGWTPDGEPLGIDVTFSIVDMSSIMHMPIAAGLTNWDKFLGTASEAVGTGVGAVTGSASASDKAIEYAMAVSGGVYDEDSTYTDYLGILGSLSLQEMVLSNEAKWTLRRTAKRVNYQTWRSPANLAIWTFGSDNKIGRVMQALVGYSAIDR